MPPKILFLVESLKVGGAEKALVSLLSHLDYNQFDVTLKLISRTGDFVADAEKIPNLHMECITLPSSNLIADFANRLKIKSLYYCLPAKYVGNYLCKGYDVVIAFCEGYLTKWVAASTINCKKIAWVHTDMVDNDWPLNTGVFNSHDEEVEAYSKFDNVVGVTKLVSHGMKEKFACKNVTTIYNILDPAIQKKANEPIEHLKHRGLNIVGVGRLEKVKGFDRLIDAMNILVNKRKADIQLTIVGDGSCRNNLEQLVKNHNLGDYVHFIGRTTNPYPYMKWADAFICPSRQEGFNIAILEAMTLGKAIVSTDCVGPKEILADGQFGRLVKSESMAECILHLYESQEEIKKLSSLSSQRAMDFNAATQIKCVHSILQL